MKAVRCLQQSAAYEAGYKTRPRQSASEMRNPKYFPLVVKYIGELRAEVQGEVWYRLLSRHVSRAGKDKERGLEEQSLESAAVNAEVARGKAGGLYVDQKLSYD